MRFLVSLLLLPFFTQAQILNIDKVDTSAYVNKKVFAFNFGTGLEVDRQQATVWDMSNSLDASLQKMKELLIFSSGYRFTYNGPSDILNTGYFHLRFRHDYKNTLHPESYLQYQWDTKLGMNRRALAGANIRWNNYLHPKLNLIVATGFFFEDEKWDYSAVPPADIPAHAHDIENKYIRSNSYIKFEFKAGDRCDLFFTTYFQFRPDKNYASYRIANTVKWSAEIAKHLNFELNFNSVYDAHPVVPIEHYYYSLQNTLVLKF